MDMKRHLKSALKHLGFDKPRKAQIIPMNTLDAGQDTIVIAATGSGKQVIYETVGLAHSDKMTIVIEPLQMVNHLVEVAVSVSDSQVQDLSWFDFLDDITEPELIQYLKERRLYVNEPVNTSEDE